MKKVLLVFTTFIFLLHGCKKDSQYCDEFPNSPIGLSHWQVLTVSGPSTSLINQPITLDVAYPTSSGCDYVSEFRTLNCDKNIFIKAFGTTLQNTFCTQSAVPKNINYEFTPTVKGKYILKFINPDESIITHDLTVN